MDLPLKDDHRVKAPTFSINTLDGSGPLSVPRLDDDRPIPPIRSSNHLSCASYSHLEASLIEIVDIAVEDAISSNGFLYPLEPRQHLLRIFAQGSLIVVLSGILRF
jgi:hypothetical protein